MKGLLTTAISFSTLLLLGSSVNAQQTTPLRSAESLQAIPGVECGEYLSGCFPDNTGDDFEPIEERVKYTQEELNYIMTGDTEESATIQLNPDQKAESENFSSPNGLVLIRF